VFYLDALRAQVSLQRAVGAFLQAPTQPMRARTSVAQGLPAGGGAPAHLSLAPTSLRGSVVIRRGRPGGQEVSCGYQLDRLEANGALVGSSACGGMPQDTRVEVDPRLNREIARHDLAVFLIAALAAPPFSPHERI
jgi:hypothetical protein